MTDLQTRITNKENEIHKLALKFDQASRLVSEEFLALINQYLRNGDYTPLKEYRIKKYPNSYYLQGNDYDLYNIAYDLYRARNTLEKYNNQLIKQEIINKLPDSIIEFKNNLIEKWDRYDEYKKEEIKKAYYSLPDNPEERRIAKYDLINKWGRNYYDWLYITKQQIHKNNVRDADKLILNMIDRVSSITGTITDTAALYLDYDNLGYSIINGIIKGTKGIARIESIGAGGYNIQRYHIRVLVKEVK